MYSTQLKDRGIVLKLNSKNLSTTGFLFLGEVSFFRGEKSREGEKGEPVGGTGGGVPSQAMELQEMGVDGQGSTGPSNRPRICGQFFLLFSCMSKLIHLSVPDVFFVAKRNQPSIFSIFLGISRPSVLDKPREREEKALALCCSNKPIYKNPLYWSWCTWPARCQVLS